MFWSDGLQDLFEEVCSSVASLKVEYVGEAENEKGKKIQIVTSRDFIDSRTWHTAGWILARI